MKRILFTGGGSAGHVIPNLALMQELAPRYALAYMGTDGMERALVSAVGCPYFVVNCPKLRRSLSAENLAIPFRLAAANRAALRVMKRHPPDLVFSKGGYVSYPAIWAAHRLKVPVLTHESDLTPGLCTRLAARKCRYVLTSFPETAARFRNGKYVGSPVRRALYAGVRADAMRRYAFDGRKPVLLVLGGGSGSRSINEAVRARLAPLLLHFDILHLCGKGNLAPHSPRGYVQREFETDMAGAYACADLALSRAGSNTVFELLSLAKPALLVPLAHATRGNQAENARYSCEKHLCAMLAERDLAELPAALLRLYGNAEIRAALRARRRETGTENIVALIDELMR